MSFAYAIKRTDDANSLILLFIMVNKNEVLLIQSLLFCLLQWPLTYAIYHMLSIVDNISSRSVKGVTESWFWFCCENQKVDFRVQVLLNVIAVPFVSVPGIQRIHVILCVLSSCFPV